MSITYAAKLTTSCRVVLVLANIALLPMALVAGQAHAAGRDYRFELAGPLAKAGKTTVVRVRLVHLPDGKPVPGATIVQTKLDMGPEGMASMTAPSKAVPTRGTTPAKEAAIVDPGVYEIETEPSMAGNWALSLVARVDGESDPVEGTVTVPVAK